MTNQPPPDRVSASEATPDATPQVTPHVTGEIAPAEPGILPGIDAESTPEPIPPKYIDENGHVRGICFEAAWDAAGRIFILRTAEEHIRFYDLADNSGLCRRAVEREPRDFSTGYVIVGLWNRGRGCTANHEVRDFVRSDDARLIVMRIAFSTAGNCPYDLVRPFWVGIPSAADYEITLIVEGVP